MIDHRSEGEVWKGLVAGLAAGLVGGWVMNRFQSLSSRLIGDEEYSEHAHSPKQSGRTEDAAREKETGGGEDTPGNIRLASEISEKVFDRELNPAEKKAGGQVVHYAFSAVTGALYGAMAELTPAVSAGVGAPFGAAVWVLADQIVLPATGLSEPPAAYPVKKNAYSLAAHFVYGVATETARRALRQKI